MNRSVPSRWSAAVLCLLLGCCALPDIARALEAPDAASWTAETRQDRMNNLVRLLRKKGFPTESELRTVSHDVDSLLSTLVNDPAADHAVRLEGVWALRYFRNKRAQMLLRSIVTDPVWQKPFRLVGMVSFAHVQGNEAYDLLRDYCLDSDEEVRVACIEALEVIGGESVLAYLQSLQTRERDPEVLRRIDQAIRNLSAPMMEIN